jgi:hypothetical protein
MTPSLAGLPPRSSRLLLGLIGVAITTLCGCVKKEVQGETTHFSLEFWVIGLAALLGIVLLVGGWRAAQNQNWKGYVSLLGGAFLLIGVVPGMFIDYAKLDSQHLEGRYGFWFSPTKYDIPFAEVQNMRVVETKSYSRRGSKYNYRLEMKYKNGNNASISLGDLLKEAISEVTDRASAAGVQVLPMQRAQD